MGTIKYVLSVPGGTGEREEPFAFSTDTHNAMAPMHNGHHPVCLTAAWRVDICNMADDVVAGSLETGRLYRFPITLLSMPWLIELLGAMNEHDLMTRSPHRAQNAMVRALLEGAAVQRLTGQSHWLNVFDPGPVFPSRSVGLNTPSDNMLDQKILLEPGTRVPGEDVPRELMPRTLATVR